MRVFILFPTLLTVSLAFGIPFFDSTSEGHHPNKASDEHHAIKASDLEGLANLIPEITKDETVPEAQIQGDQSVPVPQIEKPSFDNPTELPYHYLEAPEIHQLNEAQKDYYQGDIALTQEQRAERSLSRAKRQAYKDSYYPNTLWQQDGPISYMIDSSLPSTTGNLIRQALKYWSNHTCLTFVENGNTGTTKIRFYAGTGCWSYIGKIWYWDQQDISIGKDCQTQFGMISHEIGHALGLFHAQSRFDRDNFVSVNTQYITEGGKDQFNKETTSSNDNFGVKYDYGSVMHYSDTAFTAYPNDSSKKTITAKEPFYQRTMGGRIAPSFSDVKVINSLYNCGKKCSNTLSCQNGGYVNPSTCNTCICPWGFGGQLCTERQQGTNGTCGQDLTATPNWQSLTRYVGKNDTTFCDTFTSCYWHIKSAPGTKVQIQVQFVGLVCSGGCFYGGVEFKMTEFTRTGYRMCCSDDYADRPTFTSTDNFAIIGAHARYNLQYFVVQYRQL